MKKLLVLAAAATANFANAQTNAQTTAPAFPGSKPVTFVVPYAAGGPTDRVARDLAEAMRKTMGGGANFVVENVNGAGGTIGAAKVAKAAPDGYNKKTHFGWINMKWSKIKFYFFFAFFVLLLIILIIFFSGFTSSFGSLSVLLSI